MDNILFPVIRSVVGPESVVEVDPLCNVQLNFSFTDCVHLQIESCSRKCNPTSIVALKRERDDSNERKTKIKLN